MPVGRRQQQQIGPLTVPLPNLKDHLLGRHIVATMTIEQQDSPKSMKDNVFDQPIKQIEISAWAC